MFKERNRGHGEPNPLLTHKEIQWLRSESASCVHTGSQLVPSALPSSAHSFYPPGGPASSFKLVTAPNATAPAPRAAQGLETLYVMGTFFRRRHIIHYTFCITKCIFYIFLCSLNTLLSSRLFSQKPSGSWGHSAVKNL